MSLIKEALDKVQEEGHQQERPPAEDLPDNETGNNPTPDGQGMKINLSTILTSVIIVILAALIGGQIVLLLAMFVF